MTKKTVGVISMLAASIMWAVEPILAKLSYQTTDYLNTFATRTVFSLVVIIMYLAVTNKIKAVIVIKKVEMSWLVYLSLTATLFADLMYTYALTRVPVINAVLIGHMQPVFIIFMTYFILKTDRLTVFDYLGVLSMIIAGVLVAARTAQNLISFRIGTVGDLYVLLATIAWATTAVTTRKYLRELDAGVIAFYRFLFAGIVYIAYLLFTSGIKVANAYQVCLGFVIGIGTILYYEGLRRIKAAQVSALELSTPFFAAILGSAILKEYVTIMQGAGMFFLIVGIYFLSRKESG